MEILEDNIIQNKLNSLDTLPESYTPNLDSKWSMLEAGLEGNKKTIATWKPIAAAALLLLLGGATLLLQQIKPRAVVTSDNVKPERLSNTITPIASAPTLNQTETVTKPAHIHSAVKQTPTVAAITNEILTPVEEIPVQIMVQAQEIQPMVAAIPKVKKQQFVEIDFNDVPFVKPQNMEPSIAFRPFNLNTVQQTSITNESQRDIAFRLQKSF